MTGPAEAALDAMEAHLGHRFRDRALLAEALTHPSACEGAPGSYERLEFLGDAVLGLVMAQHLFERFPTSNEGDLTRIKSSVVSRTAMARLGLKLDLNAYLTIGRGMVAQGALPQSVTGNAMEAVIGALYLDGGLEAARAFLLRHLAERVEKVVRRTRPRNAKSQLQHLTQACAQGVPTYRLLSVQGPDHRRQFEVCAVVQGREFPVGTGASKKAAEQRAARIALRTLEAELDERGGSPPPAGP